jgi:hypothetical protein
MVEAAVEAWQTVETMDNSMIGQRKGRERG